MLKRSRQYYYILLSSILITLSSCAEYKLVTIQTLEPSEVVIPHNFRQPLVVVNLYEAPSSDRESMAQAALDSTIGMEAALVLAEALSFSPWFEHFDIPVGIHYRNDNSRYILPFKWEKVDEICEPYGADLLISIDYVKLKQSTRGYNYMSGSSIMYYGELQMDYHTYWRVYDRNQREVLDARMIRDTMVWQNTGFQQIQPGYQLPGFFAAAAYCGYDAAQQYSSIIAPWWEDEQRLYYQRGSRLMRQASKLVQEDDWLQAASLWRQVFEDPESDPPTAARAAFNMALANEIMGNFEVAIGWLDESRERANVPEREWYLNTLKERMEAFQQLMEQE